MSNTRIFASDLQFGEFRAILRGVVVKKIHNLAKGKWRCSKHRTMNERGRYVQARDAHTKICRLSNWPTGKNRY